MAARRQGKPKPCRAVMLARWCRRSTYAPPTIARRSSTIDQAKSAPPSTENPDHAPVKQQRDDGGQHALHCGLKRNVGERGLEDAGAGDQRLCRQIEHQRTDRGDGGGIEAIETSAPHGNGVAARHGRYVGRQRDRGFLRMHHVYHSGRGVSEAAKEALRPKP